MYLDQLIFQYCFYYSLHFGYWICSIQSGCQTVWIKIRPYVFIWVQTVCKGYQQMTKVATSLHTTLWLKAWLKSISFGSNFFHLAKMLATTNSELGLALKMYMKVKRKITKQTQNMLLQQQSKLGADHAECCIVYYELFWRPSQL